MRIGNKPSRVTSITQDLERALEAGTLPVREAEVLKGRLVYAAGQAYARQGAAALSVLGEHINRGCSTVGLRAAWALRWWHSFITQRSRES